jgi:hypothetical protein
MVACPNSTNYTWNDVQVVAYDVDQAILFGPTTIGDLEDTNAYLDPRLWRWASGNYHSDTEIMEQNKGYWVRARRDQVALRFPTTAQTSEKAILIASHTQLTSIAEETPPMPFDLGIYNSSSTKDSGSSCFIGILSSNDK